MEQTNYKEIVRKISALTEGIPYAVANLSNVSALLLWQELPGINWVGFYQWRDGALVLGPFQGKPACIRIPAGRGVCGAAVAEDRVLRVENVHEFPGHIACDCASNSEIVLPIHREGAVWGVLDIDSPHVGRFTEEDQAGLERVAAVLERMLADAR